jgi:hypothetical protein
MPSGRCRGPVQRDQTVDEFQWRQTGLGDDYSVEESMDFGRETSVPRCIIGVWNFCASFEEDVLEVEGSSGRVCMQVFSDSPILVSLKDGSPMQHQCSDPKHIQQPLDT